MLIVKNNLLATHWYKSRTLGSNASPQNRALKNWAEIEPLGWAENEPNLNLPLTVIEKGVKH